MEKVKIYPSILAADPTRLGDEIRRAEEGGADGIHVDVMDGHFVDNLTIGPFIVEAVRKATKLPIDTHLMIREPERFAGRFIEAGSDSVTFHIEAVAFEHALQKGEKGYSIAFHSTRLIDFERAYRIIGMIRDKGAKAGVALNPDTMTEVLEGELVHRVESILVMTVWPGFGGQKFIDSCVEKVRFFRRLAPRADIQVDGGIVPETAAAAAAAGANVFIAGTSVFRAPDAGKAIADLRRSAESAPVRAKRE